MKYVLWIVGIFFGLILTVGVLQIAASERVEVVELHTLDAAGEEVTTRLWIVDHEGKMWLRGESGSGWYDRLDASEQVDLSRDGKRWSYTYNIRNEKIDTINRLMREKYTWGDRVIEIMLGSRAGSNAIELTPVSAFAIER